MGNSIEFIFLEKFADALVKEIKKLLVKKGKKSSGTLIRSIDYEVVQKGNMIDIQLLGESYFVYVDKGRKPGKFPPIKEIKKWIQKKRIKGRGGISDDSLAFLIARSIKENGIDPTNVLEESIQNVYRSNKLNKALFETMEDKIDVMLKNLGFQ